VTGQGEITLTSLWISRKSKRDLVSACPFWIALHPSLCLVAWTLKTRSPSKRAAATISLGLLDHKVLQRRIKPAVVHQHSIRQKSHRITEYRTFFTQKIIWTVLLHMLQRQILEHYKKLSGRTCPTSSSSSSKTKQYKSQLVISNVIKPCQTSHC